MTAVHKQKAPAVQQHGEGKFPTTQATQPEKENEPMLIQPQSLSNAARQQWRLAFNPFDTEPSSEDEVYASDQFHFAREVVWQAIKGGRLTAIVGESGAGKTTIVNSVEEEVMRQRLPIRFIRPDVQDMEDGEARGRPLRGADIHAAIILTLDPKAAIAQTKERRARQVRQLLERSTEDGYKHLLVIEEGHAIPTATLNQLKRMREALKLGSRPMLGVLVLGHQELEKKLNRHDTREVMQRTEVIRLHPLGADLTAYLQHRMQALPAVADKPRQLSELITPEGVDELKSRLSVNLGGKGPGKADVISTLYPLNVGNWMAAALNTAAALGAPKVDRDVVRAI